MYIHCYIEQLVVKLTDNRYARSHPIVNRLLSRRREVDVFLSVILLLSNTKRIFHMVTLSLQKLLLLTILTPYYRIVKKCTGGHLIDKKARVHFVNETDIVYLQASLRQRTIRYQ